MHGLRDFGNALLIAMVSMGLVAGSLSISSAEFAPEATPTSTSEQLPSPLPLTATPSIVPTVTVDFSQISATPSLIPTLTVTSTPPANCQIPSGWLQITVQPGETLDSIAARYRVSAADIQRGNCLPAGNVVSGTSLYVPPVAPNTIVACIPGAAGWTKSYIVKPGDNLYRIGLDHYAGLDQMRRVNCRAGDTIYTGELLWIPNVASRTPPPSPLPGTTSTFTPDVTEPFTITVLPYTITYTPTIEPISTLPVFTIPASATLQTQP
jgi:LysM repeat protein